MSTKDLKQAISSYTSQDLEQRKRWYSPAAEAYNKTRPRYPEKLIQRVVEIAQLSSNSKILEVGCGPGTATVALAQYGFSMICVEPNPDFYQLVQQNCASYPNVEIQNTSFEEWILETEKFDLVLAASSFHWIPLEVGYLKAANALRADGQLILLWNMELQPRYEVYQDLSEVYKVHAPSLARYEEREDQEESLRWLGQVVIDSGKFKELVSEQFECEVTYSVKDYLMLLSTYSPYLKLDSQSRDALFAGLREKIEQNYGGSLELSYLSAFHIARKH
ncbi:MAG: class I SAM-dependent methyltransferase [Chroococcidiopsidaceae cyanobacterium CP_BM_RX_35]|nr:class I SAM-dependent methyltransferase [Chroococcidiopsidaceae cyanobacterium CP_BM_RX_35]